MRKIFEDTNFTITFRNREGKEVTIDQNESFDVILKHDFCKNQLCNCYFTLSQTNETNFPYDVQLYDDTSQNTIPSCSVPIYSLDIYPSHFINRSNIKTSKEENNVDELLIDETEKLSSNIILKLETK